MAYLYLINYLFILNTAADEHSETSKLSPDFLHHFVYTKASLLEVNVLCLLFEVFII